MPTLEKPILTVEIRRETDIVSARRRAREIARLLRFDPQDQTRVGTALSEIARNAFQYAGSGKIQFALEDGAPPFLLVRVTDRGPGISDVQAVLDGRYVSRTGMGLGILGARRLMDRFQIESRPGEGTMVLLGKRFTPRMPAPGSGTLGDLGRYLARRAPEDPLEEIQEQNQELLRTLDELQRKQAELGALNVELEDTNRGVVALYAELDEKAEHLRRSSDVKSRFLANMSHELRTPLNSIVALTRLLLDRADGDLTGEQERQVQFIRTAAETLTAIVNDLLDLAKVEAGKLTVVPASFDVRSLFSALRGMLRPLAAQNPRVTLTFVEPGDLPPLETDESKLSQILRNFISNALKFTDHGDIHVTAAEGPDGTVIFSVSDTGIGIAPGDQERIFEEYVQLSGGSRKSRGGTGLGLPLSRKLAELLGGQIQLTSSPGTGSTFSVAVPRIYRAPAQTARAVEPARAHEPGKLPIRALIIDDDEASRYILAGLLSSLGCRVLEAATGPDGIELARREAPAVLFLDLRMPGMDGFEVLENLRREPATAAIPVIVSTSKILDGEDWRRLDGKAMMVLMKDAPSREAALGRVAEALGLAGIWAGGNTAPGGGGRISHAAT